VCASADIDAAVEGAMVSKFRNAGQTCVCSDRFLVHESVLEEFSEKLVSRASELKIADGHDSDCEMACLISEHAVTRTDSRVKRALATGCELLTGGERMPDLGPHFFQPTILTNVNIDDDIWRLENFAPLVAIKSFSNIEEALEIANNTNTGLCNYFYTNDEGEKAKMIDELESGMIGVNSGIVR